jgi:hypothetical protein
MNSSEQNLGGGKKLACALANHTAHVLDVQQPSKQRVYSGGCGYIQFREMLPFAVFLYIIIIVSYSCSIQGITVQCSQWTLVTMVNIYWPVLQTIRRGYGQPATQNLCLHSSIKIKPQLRHLRLVMCCMLRSWFKYLQYTFPVITVEHDTSRIRDTSQTTL